ncbi:MAG: hypothetical protein HOD27_07355 [Betaproteobacteria bacterium]|nr:hypothetical protein [Betaproteobacteria bacterium]
MFRKYLKNFAAVCLLSIVTILSAEEIPNQHVGTWSGAWYEGMTSGKLWVTFKLGGHGSIRFTNLDKFGVSETTMSSLHFFEKGVNFSANGEGIHDFVSRATFIDKNTLKGKAEFDGLAVTFRLSKE